MELRIRVLHAGRSRSGDEVVMAEGYLQDSRRCESKFQRSNKLDITLPSMELVTWRGADWVGG
jgi:hypothetical protein